MRILLMIVAAIVVALFLFTGKIDSVSGERSELAALNGPSLPSGSTLLRALRAKGQKFADTAGCGLCTTDDDCGGSPHKCCQGDCPSGQKKCYNNVATCP